MHGAYKQPFLAGQSPSPSTHTNTPHHHYSLIHSFAMFVKASLIALALAMSTSASPVFEGLGASVPFGKRDGMTTADGWFDHPRAIQQVVKDHKYVPSTAS